MLLNALACCVAGLAAKEGCCDTDVCASHDKSMTYKTRSDFGWMLDQDFETEWGPAYRGCEDPI
jgi:hypothetical protein